MSLSDEYRALTAGTGVRLLPSDVLAVEGPEAQAYLQGQCSQDVAALAVGEGAPSLLLEPDGKLCALVTVFRRDDQGFAVTVAAGSGPAVAARLGRFRLRTKVDIAPAPWEVLAVRGAGAPPPPAVAGGDAVAPFGHGGWTGWDLLAADPATMAPAGAVWCGEAAWEACRVEAGVAAMGRELDGRTIAAEADLVAGTVSFTKGCYTGQELVARLDARGNRVARRLCAVVGDAAAPESQTPPWVGAEVCAGDRVVGTVTSAAWCPGPGAPAGLAFIHRSVDAGAAVTVDGAPATVRRLPLSG